MGLKLSRKIRNFRNLFLESIKKRSLLLYKIVIIPFSVLKFLYKKNKKKSYQKYSDKLDDINNYEFKKTSQNNEDGIIKNIFDRIKLENSIRISCTKRPISEQIIQEVMMRIEKKINNFTNIEISSKEIGKFAMDELKSIDKVAFIRFASVYREFKDLGEFKTHIDDISN